MVPQPKGHYGQAQRLTTALKNICRDYPAGGGVLRELLQNADDAGATEVRFVLDERTHPVGELLNPKLEQYQGPALLAYNNAIFRDEDFQSLSRLGDSLKFNDGSTTGKFGRGFNSVYNWTDSPSIVSREHLLILDPHYEWSESAGPLFDFVEDSEDLAIKNHMSAFQAVMKHFGRPLEGTVIRIPLRNQARASISEISNRETTISELSKVLKSFADEFGETGLLFMRNIEKLEIEAADISIGIQLTDVKSVRPHKSKVNNAVKAAFVSPGYSFQHAFEVAMEHKANGKSKKTTFLLHHSIECGLIDETLRAWAKGQKYIPWVAIAAQLPIQASGMAKGSLFTVLPLPIATNQPVHIHGLFSISPDRARLYQLDDKSAQDREPGEWNKFLFQNLIPAAWTKLLCGLADLDPGQPSFEKWPQPLNDPRDSLNNALENVVATIEKESLALWHTGIGYKTATNSLLGRGVESVPLRNALQEAGAPVVYIPEQLRHQSRNLFKGRILSPQSLCSFLRSVSDQIKSWSQQTKHEILEYLLAKPGFTDYGGLDLFLFEDGMYRSVGETNAFVHRDPLEADLFSLEGVCNLDLRKFSASAKQALKLGCQTSDNHSAIRYRSARDLRQYCLSFVFKDVAKYGDFVELDERAATAAGKIRKWILDRGFRIEDEEISCLWLLPVSNGCHRRIKPRETSSQVYFAPSGDTGDLMRRLDANMTSKPLPLLNVGPSGLTSQFLSMIREIQLTTSTLFVQDASRIVPLLQYLQRIWPLVDHITDKERLLISKVVTLYSTQGLNSADRNAAIEALSHIPIFERVSWKAEGKRMKPVLTWTELSCCSGTFGLLDGISPVPEIDDVQFISAPLASSSNQLLQTFALGQFLDAKGIIQNFIIPAWESRKDLTWTSYCKEHLAKFVLSHFSLLSLKFQKRLRRIPMIPVSLLDGKETCKFALAEELIDPSVPELTQLCFDDEEIVPKESFLQDFNVALNGCGLKTTVDEFVAVHRIRCYASNKYPLQEVRERASRLLKSDCRWMTPQENQAASELRQLKWLPVVDLNGNLSLKASDECRGKFDRLLVGSQLPLLVISISVEWKRRFGWQEILPANILLSQLQFGIKKNDRDIVDAVLTYISQNGLTETLASSLADLACVFVNSDLFVKPSHAFRPSTKAILSCKGLQPYLANVDTKFWRDHKELLIKINVGDKLQLSDLLKIQSILESKLMLEDSDVAVAIEIAKLASIIPTTSLNGLKILGKDGKFHLMQDINYDDLGFWKSKEKVNLTHQDIPLSTIQNLGIEGLRERSIKGLLEIEDVDDEDEFDQRENVTTRIADTLDRYPVETTFREYLANADDCEGASRISWMLDQRSHPTSKLLTPEMEKFQGSALLVHNDGVFSDDDFKGFKNVGEGSKTHDKTTIGQFGRGSQTMYHWTDVPMILSGRFLVILDPQQEVLPRNQIKGKRKPGVRLELSRLRDVCSDQLVPFEGLWGFSQALDSYPGTIFRFPFRRAKKSTKSVLRNSKNVFSDTEASGLLVTYFDEARVSLLFLRRIKSIDFSVHGHPEFGWSVSRVQSVDEDADLPSKSVKCQYTKKTNTESPIIGQDEWWVSVKGLFPDADRLPNTSRRSMKNVECGMAALISSTLDSLNPDATVPKVVQSRVFSTLPLPISSDLPVHVHATFLLSGDRQSLAIDEYGINAQEAGWNRYLLQEHLPKLYLSFLEDIGTQVFQRVFSFWPQEEPPKRSCAEVLCTSFWQELTQSSQRLFPKSQPILEESQSSPWEALDFSQAVFDFLPKTQSEALAPLLIAMHVNLVRDIPAEVARLLERVPGVKSITSPMLRALFKSAQSGTCLAEVVATNKNHQYILEVLFGLMIPLDAAKFGDLDGCHILPLADGTVDTLKFQDTDTAISSRYFVVTEDELKLFKFASRHLVTPTTRKLLARVLDSGKFNLTSLKLCDVKKLLEMKPGVPTPTDDEDKWLQEFWKYWDGHPDSSLSEFSIDNLNANIFRATLNGEPLYAGPARFHGLPAVVEPLMGDHQKLCDKFPNLWRFDDNFMPKSLRNNEMSFNSGASFYRFIRTLRRLAGETGIGPYVSSRVSGEDLKVLQTLVISHVSKGILTGKSDSFPGLANDLKSIPLWPVFHPSFPDELVSATSAFTAANEHFLVPWMKDSSRFILPSFLRENSRHKDCLTIMEVRELATEVLFRHYVLPLPSTLSVIYWQYYPPLISAIARNHHSRSWSNLLHILTDISIAADGNYNLRKASQLYDHEDRIFASAFRHQAKTRFIHPSVQGELYFWRMVGLRQVNYLIDAADYIQCLQVLKLRLNAEDAQNDPDLEQDLQTVLSPLIDRNYSTRNFSARDWQVISQERVFRSRTDFSSEPEYRRDAMVRVAIDTALPLSEVVLHEHAAICWSQTPFVVHEPTEEVLGKIAGHGHPDMDMVWQHLQHMTIISEGLKGDQIQDFLTELNLIYQYLQDHLVDAKAGFRLGNSAVWLNLHTLDYTKVQLEDIDSSWQGLENLVLSSSCDAGPIQAVRPSLTRFETLLRGLGCSSISYPTITRPTLHTDRSVSKSLQQLRRDEKLLDITYLTEGKLIKAHKVVLAAMSEKCALQFNSRWTQEDCIKYDENTDPDDYMSYHTLSTMINYAYDEDIDWSAMEVLGDDDEETRAMKLDLLLDLHKGADFWFFPTLKSQVEDKILVAGKAFVNLSNVVEIRARAEVVRAMEFERWCAEIIRENQHIVDKARSGN